MKLPGMNFRPAKLAAATVCAGIFCAVILPSLSAGAATKLRVTRPATRIQVTPAYPSTWPPPNWQRRCTDWYAIEHRPSGTVITPQMHCQWARP